MNFPPDLPESVPSQSSGNPDNLLEVPPGEEIVILSIEALPASIRATLQAYGVAAGKQVQVLQHHPETVIEVEATELAFEKEVAALIKVNLPH